MGSRAVVVACRDEASARERFGVTTGEAGIVYTRTGRRFFNDANLERRFLDRGEAGELLGKSERQFRRYRERYEEDGEKGLLDRRLGKPSPKRVPACAAQLMLELYAGVYRGPLNQAPPVRSSFGY